MVKHILKNGTSVKSIDGHIIKSPEIQAIIKQINERKNHEKEK